MVRTPFWGVFTPRSARRVAGSEFAPFRALGTRVPAVDATIPRYEWLNHGQLFARIEAFAAALAAVGTERGGNGAGLGVLICGENSAECTSTSITLWTIADTAVSSMPAHTCRVMYSLLRACAHWVLNHGCDRCARFTSLDLGLIHAFRDNRRHRDCTRRVHELCHPHHVPGPLTGHR